MPFKITMRNALQNMHAGNTIININDVRILTTKS